MEARSCADALEHMSSSARSSDVVVLDCRVAARIAYAPCVDLIHSLWRRYPWLPVVLIGEAPGEQLRADVLLTGVRQFLTARSSAALLIKTIARVVRKHGTMAPSPSKIAVIRRVFVFLDEHAGDGPTLRDLAGMARMSRSHFSRTFHAVAGTPLRTYIRELRLKRAHALLMHGTLSLTSVAVESGFYDLPHFDKAFRRFLGISPRAFRARHAARRLGKFPVK